MSMTENPRNSVPFPLLSREGLEKLCREQQLTDAKIAELFGVTANEVYARRKQMNLLDGQMSSEEYAQAVRIGEQVKHLPFEAVQKVQEIVEQHLTPRM
ncbi:MAG: hypothetical protein OWQ59_10310 [Alicyclobacillaceae bacterium]|jgi:Zn-dependent peptidase ImmA (M78 family)|uniref:hypothetical protein n=1 Tax=Alicyclobacillus sp. SP_1 TaxID=2942475 RepID=UPI0021577C9B|nr:hypothetical protein [Alicyclobacillus sp. SP_1]MCY0888836.1 hypothetical protein [Alicyclobacillaceae bacterium]MCY0897108.1 hypothetical protein [Alicyclobacillaceae bacterium]